MVSADRADARIEVVRGGEVEVPLVREEPGWVDVVLHDRPAGDSARAKGPSSLRRPVHLRRSSVGLSVVHWSNANEILASSTVTASPDDSNQMRAVVRRRFSAARTTVMAAGFGAVSVAWLGDRIDVRSEFRTVHLRALVQVEGEVVDAEGLALGSAEVAAWVQDDGSLRRRAVVSRDGRFLVEAPSGVRQVGFSARAPGFRHV